MRPVEAVGAEMVVEVGVGLTDPELEGKAERIGVEESSRVAYERGGYRRLVLARIVYKESAPNEAAPTDRGAAAAPKAPTFRIVTVPLPKEIMERGMLSMIAHLLTMKYVLGVPFHRYEQHCTQTSAEA